MDDPTATRWLSHPDPTCRAIPFSPDDINRLRNPTSWINDDCLNGCAQLLVAHFGTGNVIGGSFAILSSFAMAQHQDGTSLDAGMWRVSHRTCYWEKDVWIIPVHKPADHHWELAIVYFKERRIAYFDSFAHADAWEDDAKVSITKVT